VSYLYYSAITDVGHRDNGKVLATFNTTFISLIPKSDYPVNLDEFRPICLCNCIYKIIGRRVGGLLSKFIFQEKFVFLSTTQIHVYIGVAQEVIHSIKFKNIPVMVMKVDLSKACDKINWLYIKLIML